MLKMIVMKRKILFLVVGCVVTVVALAIIQGYFIYNTYLLRAKEANAAITGEFLALETSGKLDSLNLCWMFHTRGFLKDYIRGETKRDRFKDMINSISDSLSTEERKHIDKHAIFDNYTINYSNYIKSVVIRTTGRPPDTLFKGKELLYSNNESFSKETPASQSTWKDELIVNENNCSTEYQFEVISQRFYSISNWERQVLIKLSGLLVFSVLLLVFVVVLFYLSIKGLIKQKKIADIKTDFINNITHEFQTPIAAMDIAVKTLKKGREGLTPEQLGHTLDIINRQNVRMKKLFGQVTEASLAESHLSTANAEVLGIGAVKEITDDFSLSNPALHITCIHNGGVLHIDKFHLATLLINLLDNAIKYGADRVEIVLESVENYTLLRVRDNGIGIAPKEQKAIFEKFYRVQKGNVHNTKGLGLGLYYVQQAVKAYNGTISVNSNGQSGSEFLISLPTP